MTHPEELELAAKLGDFFVLLSAPLDQQLLILDKFGQPALVPAEAVGELKSTEPGNQKLSALTWFSWPS